MNRMYCPGCFPELFVARISAWSSVKMVTTPADLPSPPFGEPIMMLVNSASHMLDPTYGPRDADIFQPFSLHHVAYHTWPLMSLPSVYISSSPGSVLFSDAGWGGEYGNVWWLGYRGFPTRSSFSLLQTASAPRGLATGRGSRPGPHRATLPIAEYVRCAHMQQQRVAVY